jgi:hypothetical protein
MNIERGSNMVKLERSLFKFEYRARPDTSLEKYFSKVSRAMRGTV